jgi:WD40 repeat protein
MRIKASSLPALKMVEFSSVHCQITQVIHVHIKPWYCFCGYWFAVVDTENCPITFAFVAHHGPVYSVDCSPFHRNLFVTSSTDTTIRLYNMLQVVIFSYKETDNRKINKFYCSFYSHSPNHCCLLSLVLGMFSPAFGHLFVPWF